MTEKIDINEFITDEQIKKFGHTRETFNDSALKEFMEAVIMASEKTIHETTLDLMQQHSLTYGEARVLSTKMFREMFKEKMRVNND